MALNTQVILHLFIKLSSSPMFQTVYDSSVYTDRIGP